MVEIEFGKRRCSHVRHEFWFLVPYGALFCEESKARRRIEEVYIPLHQRPKMRVPTQVGRSRLLGIQCFREWDVAFGEAFAVIRNIDNLGRL